jgi:hypothetical protein
VGEANPAILGGQAAVRLIPRGQSAERTGVLANDRTRQALMDLYAGDDKISEAFRQGAGSRMQSAQELTEQRTEKAEKMAQDSRRMADKSLDRDGTPANPRPRMRRCWRPATVRPTRWACSSTRSTWAR